jgi:beta-galactosidase
MQRRDFIKRTSTLIAGMLARQAFAGASGPSVLPAAGERLVLAMNRNWRFSRSPVPEACTKDFDDSKFERVVIPHTNIRLPCHSFDDKDYEFVSVYRRHFKLPPGPRDRRVFVDFEGVMTASTVWLNGVRLGEYKGGYTPFSFELTPYLDFESDNVLAVEVDSTERTDIPPFGHQIDYLTFGGIYREVALRVVPATFIENIFAKTKDILTSNPSVEVDCFLQHSEPSSETLSLEVTLHDGDRVLATGTEQLGPADATTDAVPRTVRLEKVGPIVRWDLTRPKLYAVRVRLL